MPFTLITASAGSGKTYTLTQRLAERIGQGLDPSRIIATTFTVKAAQELAGRVRSTLLDKGQVAAARGIDSALIGTVNSVAGRLVAEYALDAGISPEVTVLDADTQKAAFAAAISRTAAQAQVAHADLLARTEHDADEDAPYGRGQAWQARVRDVADAARTNLLDANALRAAAEQSWQAYRRAAALPDPVPDQRARWLHELDARIADIQAELEAGTVPARSVNKTTTDLETLRRQRRILARHERAPWSGWTKIAAGSYGAVTARLLEPLSLEIRENLPADGAWQRDVHDLIALVLTTAASSLEDYEQHKRELGLIDFIDQEVQALHLLQTSPRVRESVRGRFDLLAVDEFQDTSPVQLALFLELSKLIEDRIWVGDPKQAIYGFRDADPALMAAIITALERGGTIFGQGTAETLTDSWRSTKQLVEFTNAVFTDVFERAGMDRGQIELAIPAQRAEKATGGQLEVWQGAQQRKGALSQAKHAAVIAEQIAERLRSGTWRPGDVAVLVRKNAERDAVITALQERGVPTAGATRELAAAREVQLVRAGLAAALDDSDTLALTQLVVLLEDHAAHDTWFDELMAAPDPSAVFTRWWEDPTLQGLRAVRRACVGYTPGEMIEALIDALDLPQRIKRWSGQASRRRSLDALRALAATTAEQRRAAGAPVTLTGLRADLEDWEGSPDLSALADAVWVGTIHGAKGLEWPHVVTYLPAATRERDRTWGVVVTSPKTVDVTAPLAGRGLLFWPKMPTTSDVTEALAAAEFTRTRTAREAAEDARLQYVALTRAIDSQILAVGGPTSVLEELAPAEPALVSWGEGGIRVRGRELPGRCIVVDAKEAVQSPSALPEPTEPLAATDIPVRPEASPQHLAARFRASGVESAEGLGIVGAPQRIGERLVTGGGERWERVGEAIHGYLALPLSAMSAAQQERAAQRLVQRWLVERAVGADVLRRAGQAWAEFVAAQFPGAVQLTEQPISWWNEDAQAMEGWIDTLLRLPDGRVVLVDHKSYPGEDPVGHVREQYLGQLHTYAQALAAAGYEVARVLIHLPLRGEVLEVQLGAGAASNS